jgi:hypothetical protein
MESVNGRPLTLKLGFAGFGAMIAGIADDLLHPGPLLDAIVVLAGCIVGWWVADFGLRLRARWRRKE